MVFCVVEQSEDEPPCERKGLTLSFPLCVCVMPSSLPPDGLPKISVEGNRSELHVNFALTPALYQNLPDSLITCLGVKVHPVLFNKGEAFSYCKAAATPYVASSGPHMYIITA